jgi:hypothetical protein
MNSTTITPKQPGKNPFTVICYICGREYGSKSISIHEKNCLEKWEALNTARPKAERKPKPIKPTQIPNLPLKNKNDAYNNDAFAAYQENTLVSCEVCKRSVYKDSCSFYPIL